MMVVFVRVESFGKKIQERVVRVWVRARGSVRVRFASILG